MNTSQSSAQPHQDLRLSEGTGVDTTQTVVFKYDDVVYEGVKGDTLASALLANGVRLVGRSFKYHRPRGVFTAGPEEPNALVQLGEGDRTEPNTRATQVELFSGLNANSQNCFPSVRFDVGAINSLLSRFLPAGFYYKTFMWPASLWMTYERFIRRAAGLGKSPVEKDPDNYEQVYDHCDVLVVGAGPAGLAAAHAAAACGGRVMLIDEQSEAGGSLLSSDATLDGVAGHQWVKQKLQALSAFDNLEIIPRCTVAAYLDYNFLTAVERVSDHLPLAEQKAAPLRQRFHKIRARRVVLATGSIERPLLFADNDRPGVMLANAVRTYVNRYAVLPARQIVVFTNNDSAYATALDVEKAGGEVTIVDLRSASTLEGKACVNAVRERNIKVLMQSAIVGVVGTQAIRRVRISGLDDSYSNLQGEVQELACQVIAVSGGWNPTVHLHSQARGKLEFNDKIKSFVPAEVAAGDDIAAINPHSFAGACRGRFDLADCLADGIAAGYKAATDAISDAGEIFVQASLPETPLATMAIAEGICELGDTIWVVPTEHEVGRGPRKHFHDLQNDVTVADIQLAAREGYQSVEHLKRYTTTGMGTDQGKTSNVNALAIMAELRSATIPEVGFTTFRPPYTPVTFGAIAGQYTEELMRKIRRCLKMSVTGKDPGIFRIRVSACTTLCNVNVKLCGRQ